MSQHDDAPVTQAQASAIHPAALGRRSAREGLLDTPTRVARACGFPVTRSIRPVLHRTFGKWPATTPWSAQHPLREPLRTPRPRSSATRVGYRQRQGGHQQAGALVDAYAHFGCRKSSPRRSRCIQQVLNPRGVGVVIGPARCMTTRRAQARGQHGRQPDAGRLREDARTRRFMPDPRLPSRLNPPAKASPALRPRTGAAASAPSTHAERAQQQRLGNHCGRGRARRRSRYQPRRQFRAAPAAPASASSPHRYRCAPSSNTALAELPRSRARCRRRGGTGPRLRVRKAKRQPGRRVSVGVLAVRTGSVRTPLAIAHRLDVERTGFDRAAAPTGEARARSRRAVLRGRR